MPTLNEYELHYEIGKGSQSTVYLGKCPQGSEVAVKVSNRVDEHAVERI
ncbi:MAG: hypothetical protein MK132_22585 [Lentisphaerales bacterium]|nr:hypothetical protein [Lentisphaerales bacterium]